jgi:hypothetical protein
VQLVFHVMLTSPVGARTDRATLATRQQWQQLNLHKQMFKSYLFRTTHEKSVETSKNSIKTNHESPWLEVPGAFTPEGQQ